MSYFIILLVLILLIVIAIYIVSQNSIRHETHVSQDYLNAKQIDENHYEGENKKYEVYPLCCSKCRAHAYESLSNAGATSKSSPSDVYTTPEHPNSLMKKHLEKGDYDFLVLVYNK
jgi:hypothetical protein